MTFDAITTMAPNIRAGKVKGLARPSMPDMCEMTSPFSASSCTTAATGASD
jgi:hypothetical protein